MRMRTTFHTGAANMVWKYVKAAIGRLYGFYVTRTVQNFNVENRTERLLEKNVKRVAPRHGKTEEKFQQIIDENPQIKKEIEEKRDDLLKRLQDIQIKATEPQEEEPTDKTKLPKQRLPPKQYVFGVKESEDIPVGKMSLKQIVTVVYNFKTNPQEFLIEDVVKHYKVDEEKLKSLLSYFQSFRLFDPDEHRQPKDWHEKLSESITGPKVEKFAWEVPKLEEDVKLKKPGEK